MANWPIHFTYGDRAVLYFAGACALVLILNMAHKNAAHLTNNFATILMLGPNQESRFGYSTLTTMFLVCSIVTGCLNALVFKTPLVGANSVVFAFLILYSSQYISFRSREVQTIPLTFAFVFTFWLNKEISMTFNGDGSSGIAHILGGFSGAMYVLKPLNDKHYVKNLTRFCKSILTALSDTVAELSRGEIELEFPSLSMPTMRGVQEQGEELVYKAREVAGTVADSVMNRAGHDHDD